MKNNQDLFKIILGLSHEYDSLFESKSFFAQYKRTVMMKLYLKEGYKDYYLSLQAYQPPILVSGDHLQNLDLLLIEFKNSYRKLLLNNYALAYQYKKTKNLDNKYLTEEDKKNVCLQQLAANRISIAKFKSKFGHYAVNPYELKAKRFHEYSIAEFKPLLKMCLNLKIKSKPELIPEIINGKIGDIVPVLIALRELAKSKILLIVDKIRSELLLIAKVEKSNKIFETAINV